jgi:hypothetical protein
MSDRRPLRSPASDAALIAAEPICQAGSPGCAIRSSRVIERLCGGGRVRPFIVCDRCGAEDER